MDNPTGTILSLLPAEQGTRALVAVDNSVVCPRCAAGKGCGAGLLLDSGQPRRVEAEVRPDLALKAGDRVELLLAPDRVLQASIIVYGLPLLGAVMAAAAAYWLELGDAAAALAAIAGVAAGLSLGRRRLQQQSCLQRFVPLIGKLLPAGDNGI